MTIIKLGKLIVVKLLNELYAFTMTSLNHVHLLIKLKNVDVAGPRTTVSTGQTN